MNTIGFSYFKFGYVESVKTMFLAYTKQGRLREVNTLERIVLFMKRLKFYGL